MPSLSQLEYAVAVDTHRHFGKAAKACHVSQPTLSTQLAKLEDELGVVLFDRGKQPVVPTPEGERLLAQARVVVGELRRLERLAREDESEIAGTYRLGVIPTVAPYLVPLFLGPLLEAHPRLELTVEELPTDALLDALEKERVDGGLLATPVAEGGFHQVTLFHEPFYLYVPKDHPLASKDFVHQRDIPVEELWLLSDGHCLRSQVLQLCRPRAANAVGRGAARRPARTLRESAARRAEYESGNLETLARLVERGLGCTLLPWLSVMGHKRREGVFLPFAEPVPAREISLLSFREHSSRRTRDAVATAIRSNLPRALRDGGGPRVDVLPVG